MKEKELESIDNELFGSFDPGDEPWIGGRGFTHTSVATFSDGSIDIMLDLDLDIDT